MSTNQNQFLLKSPGCIKDTIEFLFLKIISITFYGTRVPRIRLGDDEPSDTPVRIM